MPTVPSGYPDWQRVENWDSPLLADVEATLAAGVNVGSTIQDVSRYAYLTSRTFASGGPVLITVKWFLDSVGSVLIGQRRFIVHPSIFAQAQIHLKNMGPYMTITCSGLAAGESVSSKWFATNRPDDREFLPDQPLILPYTAFAVANNASVNAWPLEYWSGPGDLYIEPPATGWFLDLYGFDVTGTAQKLLSFAPTASRQVSLIVTPPGAWVFNISNLSGVNATMHLAFTPSLTGST